MTGESVWCTFFLVRGEAYCFKQFGGGAVKCKNTSSFGTPTPQPDGEGVTLMRLAPHRPDGERAEPMRWG